MFSPIDLDKPLGSADLDELDALTCRYEIELSLSGLQGFFAALASAPTLIQPSTWMGLLVEEVEFDSEQEANRVVGLLLRLYSQVGTQIGQRSTRFLPEREEVEAWCFGYMRGVELDDVWDEESDETVQEALFCIAAVAGDLTEKDLEAIFEDESVKDWLEEQRQNLPDTVLFLYDYWGDARKSREPPARKKVALNDQCLCGSGKDFKECCGKAN